MTRAGSERDARPIDDPVIAWLLDSDPSIRWQVLRDLTDTTADTVAAERSRVASEGWGARLLDQQRSDGQWGDGVATPLWWSNMYTLVFVRDLGVDPASQRARTAIDRVRASVTWGSGFGNSPFFEGEVEPCINGRVVALGAYFGERSDRLVDRLLGEQLADGGWNCEAERGSVRSSFHTTICVLEGLLAFENAFGATTAVTDARSRAHEYLLARRLLRRLSTGEIINPVWRQFAFPPLWHYDVLRGLDYLRAAGVPPDERVEEAMSVVVERRQADGRWLLDLRYPKTLYEDMAGPVGAPNRLDHASRAPGARLAWAPIRLEADIRTLCLIGLRSRYSGPPRRSATAEAGRVDHPEFLDRRLLSQRWLDQRPTTNDQRPTADDCRLRTAD